ncbi:Type III pantothenate kinase [Geodia barretti]|uniref:Type III pantothenate kinase n=1 Tax=Geodia barretti TaxID=519541 RepID=A0AA35QT03_GEOBA|nr:Type III pantothenate kinase [Geodia barretti]
MSRRLADEYGILLKNLLEFRGSRTTDFTAACICSVVPPLTGMFEDLCRRFFGVTPLLVTSQIDLGMPVRYDNPRDVGADRIVDAVAAVELYGAPMIVVDLGTATVFDAVSRDREYLAGPSRRGSTCRRTRCTTTRRSCGGWSWWRRRRPWGEHDDVVAVGIVLGYAGLVEAMVGRFKAEIGEDARVVGTGGLVTVISDHVPVFDDINQELTLVGLDIIYRKNAAGLPSSGASAGMSRAG